MRAVKGICDQGKIELEEEPDQDGPMEVLVVFPVEEDDPWAALITDPTPPPALAKFVKEVKQEIADRKTQPLNLDDL